MRFRRVRSVLCRSLLLLLLLLLLQQGYQQSTCQKKEARPGENRIRADKKGEQGSRTLAAYQQMGK